MLLIRFCILWSLVSVHVVGGAVLFRRFFPRENAWLGFIVPALVFVLVMNFIEHQVAIPSFDFLFPLTALGFLGLIVSPKTRWCGLKLPTGIFLASFAFTLFLKYLKPDIAAARDGIYDLQFISSFLQGQTLPAESTWIPPIKLIYYYAFGHYGTSVLIRAFGLDLGTGFNVAAALIAAWIYLLIAGIAWQISRHKRWITILAPILAACASTGSSGFLYLTLKDINPEDIATLYSRMDGMDTRQMHTALFSNLTPVYMYDRHELLVPGWWSWMGIFHSTVIGQFITLLATLSLCEMVRPRRSTWPWIVACGCVPLMLVSSTWGFPFALVLVATGLGCCWFLNRQPENWRMVLIGLAVLITCLTPMLLYYTTSSVPPSGYATGEQHTQILEFIVQWWPIYLPWLGLLIAWRRIHPVVAVVLFVTPIAFAGVECYTFGARFDMTGKIWGFLFAAAWATFIPAVASSRNWLFRILFAVIVINCVFSFCLWTDWYRRTINWDDVGQLEGKGDLRLERPKARILNALIPLKHQIIASGMSSWSFCPAARIANFSDNYAYITWSFNCDNDMFRNGIGEGDRREVELNDFYAGKNPDPLFFLRLHDIAAVVIWPDDDIKNDVLDKLKKQLAPSYQYEDLREKDDTTSNNCGIFLYHPFLGKELSDQAATAP